MSTTYYIKKNDTAEPLKVVMKKRQAPVEGVTPPDTYWQTSQSIKHVYFSMAKIPQAQDDGTVLYPDGTILNPDGTFLNPLGNQDIYISGVHVSPGETLNPDYSVTESDGTIRYPNGIKVNTSNETLIPRNSRLLPNGTIQLPPTPPYPTGYNYNPKGIDRTNFYMVGNPTEYDRNPDNSINLPDNTYLDADGNLYMPKKVIQLPSGTQVLSTTTVRFPAGTTKEESVTINRDNALILSKSTVYYQAIYEVTYSSSTRKYTFPSGTSITYDEDNNTATVIFPNASTLSVPYSTVKHSDNIFTFPYGTVHVFAERKFIFPGETFTLPLSATINVFGLDVSVTFESGTNINPTTLVATLTNENQLLIDGDTLLYDGSRIKLNTLHTVLYNDYEFYPRGTQKNSLGTIIHPDGYVDESPYIRYYSTKDHPNGILIRQTDGAIVNNDGTFTKLDNSIVDTNGRVIQEANTTIPYYTSPTNPPFIPVDTRSHIITINRVTASYQTITYTTTGSQTAQATLLRYNWQPYDTAHTGLYSGEFELVFTDDTVRTFPILANDALFISVLDHFSQG